MNLKIFLKPDWRKIVLTIILFIFGLFASFMSDLLCYPCPKEFLIFRYLLMWPDYFIPVNYDFFAITISAKLIVDIIWTYILSCLIVWIYDKLKGKKR